MQLHSHSGKAEGAPHIPRKQGGVFVCTAGHHAYSRMSIFAYQASHEQFSPSHLLRLARLAEEAGFGAIHSSCHFHPWSERQGQSGLAYAWLGAALATTNIPCGVVTAPAHGCIRPSLRRQRLRLQRWRPGRFWMTLGSGEALNECITGEAWPEKSIRNERPLECFHIMRRLLDGETVSHRGHVAVEDAKLYTLPAQRPPIFGAALSKETAEWMGGWAEGLLTAHQPLDELGEVIAAFRRGGGEGKPVYLQIQLAYGADEEALSADVFHQWRTNIFPPAVKAELRTVAQFDALAAHVTMEDIRAKLLVSSSVQAHVDNIRAYADLGFEMIILHNVGRNQEEFIKVFGQEVLPRL